SQNGTNGARKLNKASLAHLFQQINRALSIMNSNVVESIFICAVLSINLTGSSKRQFAMILPDLAGAARGSASHLVHLTPYSTCRMQTGSNNC
ncbi:MAG: hypothetical protein ACOYLL_07215, partial [Beijerinckiaceae bacterium]